MFWDVSSGLYFVCFNYKLHFYGGPAQVVRLGRGGSKQHNYLHHRSTGPPVRSCAGKSILPWALRRQCLRLAQKWSPSVAK